MYLVDLLTSYFFLATTFYLTFFATPTSSRTEGYERNVFVKVICCTRAFEAVYKIRNDSSAPKIFMSHSVQKV